MAILTDSIAPKSNASSLIQQHTQAMDRIEYYNRAEQQRQENKAIRSAEFRGEASADINSLQAFPGMYEVAQGMYNTYLEFENSGDVENAAMVKKQLESTLAAMQGYTTSFIQQRQSLNDDKVLAGYNNDYSQLQGIADEYQAKGYSYVGFKDGNHIIQDADGNQMTVEQMPGLSDGTTFLNDDRVVAIEPLPDGYASAEDYGMSIANSVLTTDVMNEFGNITDPEALKGKISARFDERIQLKDGQMKVMIYMDQKGKGNMDVYNEDKVRQLMEDPAYIQGLKEQFVADTYNQIELSITPKDTPAQATAKERQQRVDEEVVVDGELSFGSNPIQVKYKGKDDKSESLYLIGMKVVNGMPVMMNSESEKDQYGNAIPTKVVDKNLVYGSSEWKALSDYYGGEKYLIAALEKMPGFDMSKMRM